MLGLITFDTDDYTLDLARISSTILSVVLLRLLYGVFKQRKFVKGSYYSPVLFFTVFWLIILFATSFIPLVTNTPVISNGFWFILVAASYIWSLAGVGWVLSNYVKQYKELIEVSKTLVFDLTTKDKAA